LTGVHYNLMSLEGESDQEDVNVPFVSSSELVIRKMLEMVKLRPEDILIDLGCGKGKVIVMASQDFGASCIGIERREDLVVEAGKTIRDLDLSRRAAVVRGDIFSFDLRNADVVICYLLTVINKKLEPKIEKELKLDARLISHDFEFPDWKPSQFTMLHEGWLDHKIYLYRKESWSSFKKKSGEPEPAWRSL